MDVSARVKIKSFLAGGAQEACRKEVNCIEDAYEYEVMRKVI